MTLSFSLFTFFLPFCSPTFVFFPRLFIGVDYFLVKVASVHSYVPNEKALNFSVSTVPCASLGSISYLRLSCSYISSDPAPLIQLSTMLDHAKGFKKHNHQAPSTLSATSIPLSILCIPPVHTKHPLSPHQESGHPSSQAIPLKASPNTPTPRIFRNALKILIIVILYEISNYVAMCGVVFVMPCL